MTGAELQTSIVFSQRTWTGVGDLDDCWVLSALQCVNACAPWLHLPGTTAFRLAAGDPDDGKTDGGSVAEIIRAVSKLYPELRPLTALRGVTIANLRSHITEGRPVSVALMLDKLPPALRHGSKSVVAHQSTLAVSSGGELVFANPLAPMGSRWDSGLDWSDVVPAIRAYGNGTAFGVAFPTSAAMAPYAPGVAELVARAHATPDPALLEAARAAGFTAGFADAKGKASAAVAAIAA